VSEELRRTQALRFAFLRRLYEVSAGSTRSGIKMEEIGRELGLDRQATGRIVDYLHDEGLADWFAFGGMIRITHDGVVEVEQAIAQPQAPTEHFPPVVIAETFIQAQTITGSQFQIRTTGSQQHLGAVNADELRILIAELRELVKNLELGEDESATVEADLASAEAQLKSPQPKAGILRSAFESVQRITESAVGGAASREIAQQLAHLVHVIDQLPHY